MDRVRKAEFLTKLVYDRQPLLRNGAGQERPSGNIKEIAELLGINRAILDAYVGAGWLVSFGKNQYLIGDVLYVISWVTSRALDKIATLDAADGKTEAEEMVLEVYKDLYRRNTGVIPAAWMMNQTLS